MALPTVTLTNTQLYVRYPRLPEPKKGSNEELTAYYGDLQKWYSDFTRILQRDREEILTLINTKADA